MRVGTVVRWGVLVAVLAWAGYTATGVVWSYFAVQEIVDKAFRDASAKHRAAFATGRQVAVDDLVTAVRSSILLAAFREGFRLEEGNVDVSTNSSGFGATVRWFYPIISYEGRDTLVVPLSVHRSLAVTP